MLSSSETEDSSLLQLASFTSDGLRVLGHKYSIDILWRLLHIRVLSLNDSTGWHHIPDNVSIDPDPPKFYKEKEWLREARGNVERSL